MTQDMVATLRPLLAAEASAEAYASGAEQSDLEQAVWLRLLERLDTDGPPVDPQGWLRRAVRSEARRSRRTARIERPYAADPADDCGAGPEQQAMTAARHRALHDAVRRLPGRCPSLLAALLSPKDLTYREIATALEIPVGTVRSRLWRARGRIRELLEADRASADAPRIQEEGDR